MRYATLRELVNAADAQDIPDGSLLIVDNDAVYMYGPEDDDGRSEKLWDSDKGPEGVLVELLRLLGLPAAHA